MSYQITCFDASLSSRLCNCPDVPPPVLHVDLPPIPCVLNVFSISSIPDHCKVLPYIGYLITVVIILCLVILAISSTFFIFRRFYCSNNKRMKRSTEKDRNGYEDISLPETITNLPGDNCNVASLPKLESQKIDDSDYEDPHTYIPLESGYTDLLRFNSMENVNDYDDVSLPETTNATGDAEYEYVSSITGGDNGSCDNGCGGK